MFAIISKLSITIDPIILGIILAYFYGVISRWAGSMHVRQAAMGTVMGAAAMIAMMSPIQFADGVIVDLRSLIVGLTGAFFGLIGVAIAAAMGAIMRISIGGTGMIAGVCTILISAVMGLVWARFIRGRIKSQLVSLCVLGIIINVNLVSAFMLPAEIAISFLAALGPWLIMLNTIGALGLGSLIWHEERTIAKRSDLISAAATDPLTKLLNRRSIIDMYENLSVPKSADRGTAMLCFDIDHFKQINDSKGHLMGDQVLLQLKDRIAACLRPSDLFSRIGGDEFLIVLPDVNQPETEVISERCRAAIGQKPIICDGEPVNVTISVGANWSSDAGDFQTFFAKTDAVLYEAKALGRNCVAYSFGSDGESGNGQNAAHA